MKSKRKSHREDWSDDAGLRAAVSDVLRHVWPIVTPYGFFAFMNAMERQLVSFALTGAAGSRAAAGRELKLNRTTVVMKMKKLQML
jgi:transcriptional regulator with GAF, ATPase, and Fis domain